jgi:wobble nucleotide-excising tRNase
VFDDPVSSLDYKWREGVARRLVQVSKTRQVTVFTHDVVFLLLLEHYAAELDVEQFDQHVRPSFFVMGIRMPMKRRLKSSMVSCAKHGNARLRKFL